MLIKDNTFSVTFSNGNLVISGVINYDKLKDSLVLISSLGGAIYSGEEFRVKIAAGGLTGRTAVVIDGVASTDVTILSDTELTATAGFLQEGSNLDMVIS